MNNKPKKTTPHVAHKRFYNCEHEHYEKVKTQTPLKPFKALSKEVLMLLLSFKQRFQDFFLDHSAWIRPSPLMHQSYEPIISWIGHSSFLIQIGNTNILVDPVFGNLPLFPRIFKPGILFEQLPRIDYILISHNHLDHMDKKSLLQLRQFYPQAYVLVPHGDKRWFEHYDFIHVTEFGWWEQQRFMVHETELIFTFLPAYHWSGRNLFDKNRSLWGSWMIESNGYRIYFGGDTAYWHHFAEIGKEFPSIDVAMLPIAPCTPRRWMQKSHIDAHEAGQSFIELGAHVMVPMHWGTFYFGCDRFDTPVNELMKWWHTNKNQLTERKLMLLGIGEQLRVERQFFVNESKQSQDQLNL